MSRPENNEPVRPGEAADEAAARWLVAHDEGLTPAEQAEFDAWLARPGHAAIWAEARSAWTALDRLPELPRTSLGPLATPASRHRRAWLPLAAGFAVLLAGAAVWYFPQPGSGAEEPAGLVRIMPERRELPDGSRVELNQDAELQVDFTGDLRRVRLVSGEAYFAVAHDPRRPFVVEGRGVLVRAVGTAFNVKLNIASIEVLVTEGRVAVGPNGNGFELPAGHRAEIPREGGDAAAAVAVTAAEATRLLTWRSVRLQFQDLPLAAVAEEFNRHGRASGQPRLVIDPAVADTLVAGSLRADNVEVFARVLESSFNLGVTRRADGAILVGPPAARSVK